MLNEVVCCGVWEESIYSDVAYSGDDNNPLRPLLSFHFFLFLPRLSGPWRGSNLFEAVFTVSKVLKHPLCAPTCFSLSKKAPGPSVVIAAYLMFPPSPTVVASCVSAS